MCCKKAKDFWNVDGDQELSGHELVSPKFTLWNATPSEGDTWSTRTLKTNSSNVHASAFVTRGMVEHVEEFSAKGETAVGH